MRMLLAMSAAFALTSVVASAEAASDPFETLRWNIERSLRQANKR